VKNVLYVDDFTHGNSASLKIISDFVINMGPIFTSGIFAQKLITKLNNFNIFLLPALPYRLKHLTERSCRKFFP
jgi:hypothetical protein